MIIGDSFKSLILSPRLSDDDAGKVTRKLLDDKRELPDSLIPIFETVRIETEKAMDKILHRRELGRERAKRFYDLHHDKPNALECVRPRYNALGCVRPRYSALGCVSNAVSGQDDAEKPQNCDTLAQTNRLLTANTEEPKIQEKGKEKTKEESDIKNKDKKEIEKKEIKKDDFSLDADAPIQKPRTTLTEMQKTLFDTFWDFYPNKKGKGAAFKSWQKSIIVAKAKPETIINAVKAQVKCGILAGELQYIPHPSTWLNQERWLDEVTEAGNAASVASVPSIVTRLATDYRAACKAGSESKKNAVKAEAAVKNIPFETIEKEIIHQREIEESK